MRALSGPARAWLTQRPPTRLAAAWVLAVAGPAVVTLALMPFRSSLSLGGFFFCMLVAVMAGAVLGGTRPALTAVVLGATAGASFYDRRALIVGTDLVSLVAFVVIGAALGILIGQLGLLAAERTSSQRLEAALRRVATLVARAAPPDELFAAVAEEVGQLLVADYTRLGRYDPGDTLAVIGTWSRTGAPVPIGSGRWPIAGENVAMLVWRTGRPARIDNFAGAAGAFAAEVRKQGVRAAAGAPIIVEGRIWGVMTAGSMHEWVPPPDTETRLASFTDLVATAVANADSRAGLTRLADEHAALRRVATLVARGAPADEVFAAVATEAGQLLRADRTTVTRYESDGTATIVAGWSRAGDPLPVGQRPRLGGANLATIISRTGRPTRIDSYADDLGEMGRVIRETGVRSGVATPIIVRGHLWGIVVVNSTVDQPLAPDTEARLGSFTDLVATAISNAENLAELTASRARVVAAADETRRRIERDLHDGAQQRLISLGLALRAAQTAVPPQLARLGQELAHVADGLASVHDDLREMARGIHPAILAQGGLERALRTLARRSTVPVELDLRAAKRLPERVEVAAYYVVAEALTNVAKHAAASVVEIEVEADECALRLRVRDDGTGGANPRGGTGLVGLRDRVEALGGTLIVDSPVGAGTTLDVELPFADRPAETEVVMIMRAPGVAGPAAADGHRLPSG